MSFLKINSLKKQFGPTTVVEKFNLEVEKGELVTFLGPSGCGKSTTLRMIAGFESPDEGQIIMEERDITMQAANRRKIGMVFQSYALFPNMTVAENIAFGLKLAKLSSAAIKQRVNEMLELVQLTEAQKRYPHQISGGQSQRVALARALAPQPKLLLLDEPLSALDALIRRSLRTEIRRIQQQLGITTIFVTHDQEEALSISDRIVVMNGGRIEQIGQPFDIYNYPASNFVASFIGTFNMLPAQVVNSVKGELNLAGQVVRVTPPLLYPDKTAVTLALRPESLLLGQDHSDQHNTLPATITDISFLGAVVRVRLRLADTLPLELDLFNSRQIKLPQPNSQTQVAFAAEDGLLLPG
jgi:putative spermidine/putrescine transport system ATP-binding protein